MVKRCAICGIVDHFPDISLHRFPSDPRRRELWVEFVLNHGAVVGLTSRLCSMHFIPGNDYAGPGPGRRLITTAVPSLKAGQKPPLFLKQEVDVENIHADVHIGSTIGLTEVGQRPSLNLKQEVDVENINSDVHTGCTVDLTEVGLNPNQKIKVENVDSVVRGGPEVVKLKIHANQCVPKFVLWRPTDVILVYATPQ